MGHVLAFVLLLTFSGQALAAETPPLTEYDNVKPGLLDIDVEEKYESRVIDEPAPSDSGASDMTVTTEENRTVTIDDIETHYKAGKFDLIFAPASGLAERGQPQAQEILGLMNKLGQGIPQSTEKAFYWLSKAADAGRPLSQHYLGVMYYSGEGVTADPVRALMWLKLAVLHYPEGEEGKRAQADFDNLAAGMTRRDKDRAMAFIRDWLISKNEKRLLEKLQ